MNESAAGTPPEQPPAVPVPVWAAYPPPYPPAAPPRPRRLVPLLVAAGAAVLGAPFGLVWTALAPDVPLLVTRAGLVYAEAQPEQVVAADGWFAVLAVPFGVLLGAGAWLAGRRARGVPTLLAVTAGAIAAGALAWWLGSRIGLDGYQTSAAAADPGAVVGRPPDLSVAQAGWWPPRVIGLPLLPALAAAATYTLCAAWSRFPTLRPEPDRPGQPPGP